MIPEIEIREFARKNGVPETTVERDYAQNWLLASLSINMALKGGTGIRKVYIEDYRFSDDLDFTLIEETEADRVKNLIVKAAREAKRNSGIEFDENIGFKEVKNGHEVNVYFRILRRTGNPLKIKIDITKKENEIILLPLEKKRIIHPYSDDFQAEVLAYSLNEVYAEKIRSLFQRTRPRDLYDVWYLWKKVDKKLVLRILPGKFKIKNVEMNIRGLEQREYDFKDAWKNSLEHQLRELPEFEEVFDKCLTQLEMIL